MVGGAIADSPPNRTVCEDFPLTRLLSIRAVVIGTDSGNCPTQWLCSMISG